MLSLHLWKVAFYLEPVVVHQHIFQDQHPLPEEMAEE